MEQKVRSPNYKTPNFLKLLKYENSGMGYLC